LQRLGKEAARQPCRRRFKSSRPMASRSGADTAGGFKFQY
jgi:hypothetical protein